MRIDTPDAGKDQLEEPIRDRSSRWPIRHAEVGFGPERTYSNGAKRQNSSTGNRFFRHREIRLSAQSGRKQQVRSQRAATWWKTPPCFAESPGRPRTPVQSFGYPRRRQPRLGRFWTPERAWRGIPTTGARTQCASGPRGLITGRPGPVPKVALSSSRDMAG